MKAKPPYLRALLFGLLALVVLLIVVVVGSLVAIPRADLIGQTPLAFDIIEKVYLAAGIPIMILFGWLAARPIVTAHVATGAAVAAVAVAVDVVTQLIAANGSAGWGTVALTGGSKLLGGMAGGWLALRRVRPVGAVPLVADPVEPG